MLLQVLLLATLCSPAAAGPVTWDGSLVDDPAGLHACVDEADRTCGLFFKFSEFFRSVGGPSSIRRPATGNHVS
ncbi:hypothetical protein MTO96_034460 [Rhipicephalus appendiculatus]